MSARYPPTDEQASPLDCAIVNGILACLSWLAVYGIGCAVLAVWRALT